MAKNELPNEATRRLQSKKQTLDDAYAAPANFLEIDVVNPITHGVARARYTDFEVRMRVSRSQIRQSALLLSQQLKNYSEANNDPTFLFPLMAD